MFDSMKTITTEQQQAVHELACEILGRTGMRFSLPEARKIFSEHGFKTDGNNVLFSKLQVEKALETVPCEFDVIAPNANRKIHVGGDSRVYSSSCSSVRIQDVDGTIRPATGDDYEKTLKLIQDIDVITNCFEYVVPQDMPQEHHLLFNLCAQMHTIDKPLSCQHTLGIPMLEIYYGTKADKMRESAQNGLAYGISYVNPLSPLAMSDYEVDKLIHFCRAGIAVAIAPMALCGMSAPCTLEGLIVQQAAEILAGVVLSQLVCEGAPVLYGCLGATTNMRNMFTPVGAPESRILEHTAAQMARFYKIPSRTLTGMTDANEIDYQCGAESMLNFLVTARSGIHVQTGIGSYANWMIASYEKLILDSECAAYVNRLLRPLDFADDRAGASLIEKVGPQGSYIMEEHTIKHFRTEFLETKIFDRQPYDKYIADGRHEVKEKTFKKIDEMIANYKRPYVEEETKRQIKKYCETYGLGDIVNKRFED